MSDTQPATFLRNAIRLVFSFLDVPAYYLLSWSYMLFFNVASADMLNNETIMKFYGRVQVIIGVFMMFQLAMTILKGVVNPDSFIGDKGSGKTIITRILTALLLLAIMMPISIDNPKNEFEKRINNNGLLFGTLYSLQYRIITNNTIGRLVLGTSGTEPTFMASSYNDTLDQSTRIFTSAIVKSFYTINLVPEDQRNDEYLEKGQDPAIYNENRVCTDIDDAILESYTAIDADPQTIISMVNNTCDSKAQPTLWNRLAASFQTLTGNTKYMFAYMPILSFIIPIIFAVILLSFTIDVAVRAIKLAVLRLLAPIPIIRYMDPNGGKDSAFNSWIKALSSTYLDLFIRLATVYFVLFIVQDMIINGLQFNSDYNWVLTVFTFIAVWIGLFVFAKQAPKFIKQILGLKDDGGKLFSGFSGMLGVGAIGAGFVSGGISNASAKYHAAKNKEGGNTFKGLVAGGLGFLGGSVGGGYNAGKAYYTNKDANGHTVMQQVRSYNARNYSNAADNSTPFGRFVAGAQSNMGLRNRFQKDEEKIRDYSAAESAMKRIDGALSSNGDAKVVHSGNTIRQGDNVLLENGHQYSLKDYKDILNRVSSSGDSSLIEAVEKAMKSAQGARFDEIRSLDRKEVVRRVNSTEEEYKDWTSSDLVIYDSARTIYEVGKKYSKEPEFSRIAESDFNTPQDAVGHTDWGKLYKHDSGQAGKAAEQIKNSGEYAKAKANAQRAEDRNKR